VSNRPEDTSLPGALARVPAGVPTPLSDVLARPLTDLRLSVIDNCNLRCGYCMPRDMFGDDYPFLSPEVLLSVDEIERLVTLFAGLGVTTVRLTGGEPLLRPDLPEVIARIATIPGIRDIGLSTNGFHLATQATQLRWAGLRRVTVSLDSLDDATRRRITGGNIAVERILESIDAAVEAGFDPVKINVVVQRGVNDGEILDMVSRFRRPVFHLRFIEYMDVGNSNGWTRAQIVPSAEIRELLNRHYDLEPVDPARRGEVARRYRHADGQGEIGLISSVTEPFCTDCTRARISADGNLYTCLFSARGTDLRGLLRTGASDAEIVETITSAWTNRDDRYSEVRGEIEDFEKIEMFRMGG